MDHVLDERRHRRLLRFEMNSWSHDTGKYLADKGVISLLTSIINVNEDSVVTVLNLSGWVVLDSIDGKIIILQASVSVRSQSTISITSTIWNF